MILKTDGELKDLLANSYRIAMVGLSDKPERASYKVAQYLLKRGFQVIPVNPTINQVLGLKAVPTLKDIKGRIDIVNVFRRADQVMPVTQEAVEMGAKAIWYQLGVVNEDAAQFASDHGLKVVMDYCIKIEHNRLMVQKKENLDLHPQFY